MGKSSKMITQLMGAMLVFGVVASPAWAQAGHRPCSVQSIAGNWLFATGVGQQQLFPGQDGDITALGTMNIHSNGEVDGVFDVTVAGFAFLSERTYSGSITVRPDCRGTLTFQTDAGATRADSIAIVSQSEMLAMSQDPANLWTYQIRRISRTAGPDALTAKIDALLRRMGVVPSAFESQ